MQKRRSDYLNSMQLFRLSSEERWLFARETSFVPSVVMFPVRAVWQFGSAYEEPNEATFCSVPSLLSLV